MPVSSGSGGLGKGTLVLTQEELLLLGIAGMDAEKVKDDSSGSGKHSPGGTLLAQPTIGMGLRRR